MKERMAESFPLGLIAAVHTPFTVNGDLHLAMVERQAETLIAKGVAGVFVGGTTGECHSLSIGERQQLSARWCDVVRGSRLRVLVHVGTNCQRDASALASHAADCGALAVAAMAPFYFKPQTVSELIEFLAPIAASAPELPFYYYDIPMFTGVELEMTELLEQGGRRIKNLAGLKFTNSNLMLMQRCVQLHDGAFDVLHGFDETLLAGLAFGVRGAVGNTYNFAPSLYQRLLEHWFGGAWLEARDCQAQSVQLIATLQRYGFQEAAKAAMERMGIDCGPPRPPLRQLAPAAKRDLFTELDELNVLG
jgi:N-acetylneuraminate lyase